MAADDGCRVFHLFAGPVFFRIEQLLDRYSINHRGQNFLSAHDGLMEKVRIALLFVVVVYLLRRVTATMIGCRRRCALSFRTFSSPPQRSSSVSRHSSLFNVELGECSPIMYYASTYTCSQPSSPQGANKDMLPPLLYCTCVSLIMHLGCVGTQRGRRKQRVVCLAC